MTAWTTVAYATGPADRPAAEAGVRAAYREAGLAEPERFIWFASPAQATVAAVVLSGSATDHDHTPPPEGLPPALFRLDPGAPVRDLVLTEPWEYVRAQALSLLTPAGWAAAWEFIGGELWPRVNRLTSEIRGGISRCLADPSGASGTSPRDDLDDEIESLLRRTTLDAALGQHDAPWLAFFDGLARAGDLDLGPLDGVLRAAREAGWWWPFERVVLMCERPAELHRDDLGRLHQAAGPALAFPDGFALHAWHGMPVPAEFGAAMADLSAPRIRREENAELRRVMLEHYGFDRYLRESDAKLIQRDATGVLWRADLADDEPLVMVEVINSTPEPDGTSRTYFLRVPPYVTTAREGVAWTFGLRADQYDPEQQT
ncbi:hypothetical protein DP939_31720 [Spongiactinospora rosea]|uniref:DUF6745 domain-containing protein n=1 Tax=Spongiactinospora rosea TaxID=2248750 RepID=A0A366LQS8_9ACTN|nr:hypothetical protein DP939_31720 [Spongiactinospora rosea]